LIAVAFCNVALMDRHKVKSHLSITLDIVYGCNFLILNPLLDSYLWISRIVLRGYATKNILTVYRDNGLNLLIAFLRLL